MNLPEKREFGWMLKPLSSAQTAVNLLDTGQIEVTIEHDPIAGVTTAMLEWWFRHFSTLTVTKGGVDYPAYFLWHPYDHIAATTEVARPARKGDYLTIHEAFQRKQAFEVNERAEIYVLDQNTMGLRARKLGQTIMDLKHRFHDSPDGVIYRSRMVLGVSSGILKPVINKLVVPRFFSMEKADAWLQHNVEEVGCFENFLSALYARSDAGTKISLD